MIRYEYELSLYHSIVIGQKVTVVQLQIIRLLILIRLFEFVIVSMGTAHSQGLVADAPQ